jgi:hypothetical protein
MACEEEHPKPHMVKGCLSLLFFPECWKQKRKENEVKPWTSNR